MRRQIGVQPSCVSGSDFNRVQDFFQGGDCREGGKVAGFRVFRGREIFNSCEKFAEFTLYGDLMHVSGKSRVGNYSHIRPLKAYACEAYCGCHIYICGKGFDSLRGRSFKNNGFSFYLSKLNSFACDIRSSCKP